MSESQEIAGESRPIEQSISAESPLVDRTVPSGRWKFDGDVAAVFDDMLERSIPQYAVMRKLCFQLGSQFVKMGTAILDLGCSRGGAMIPFIDRFGATVHHVGVEISEPMLEAARRRFQGLINCSVVRLRNDDLRMTYPPVQASLTLCVLTLQFIPIEHRQRLVRKMFEHTVPGGAVIIVEKLLGSTAELDELLVSAYYDVKRQNGYSQDDIDRKRLSLEGVLVPVTAKWNEDLIRQAGFRQVECFWRALNFAGWIAVRD